MRNCTKPQTTRTNTDQHLLIVYQLVHATRTQRGSHNISNCRAGIDVADQLRLALARVRALFEQDHLRSLQHTNFCYVLTLDESKIVNGASAPGGQSQQQHESPQPEQHLPGLSQDTPSCEPWLLDCCQDELMYSVLTRCDTTERGLLQHVQFKHGCSHDHRNCTTTGIASATHHCTPPNLDALQAKDRCYSG